MPTYVCTIKSNARSTHIELLDGGQFVFQPDPAIVIDPGEPAQNLLFRTDSSRSAFEIGNTFARMDSRSDASTPEPIPCTLICNLTFNSASINVSGTAWFTPDFRNNQLFTIQLQLGDQIAGPVSFPPFAEDGDTQQITLFPPS